MTGGFVALHYNLLQDVAVLRPIARLANSMGLKCLFLVSESFLRRDTTSFWRGEIDRLAATVGGKVKAYDSLFEIVQWLGERRGICVAGSESNLSAHVESHDLFRVLPSSWLKVTLQHGYECVGFLHNPRHSATAGHYVRFAADVVVGWFEAHRLPDLAPSERSKLYVAGPPMMIEHRASDAATDKGRLPARRGMICENTHSVRFASTNVQHSFLEEVDQFARRLHAAGGGVDLRPHPAGRFLTRSDFALPPGMSAREEPIYDLNMAEYAFAISAPSTVLFDFMLADVPVALWGAQSLATGNYAGLPAVEGADALWAFAGASLAAREALLSAQRRFLAALAIPTDVSARYRSLLSLATA